MSHIPQTFPTSWAKLLLACTSQSAHPVARVLAGATATCQRPVRPMHYLYSGLDEPLCTGHVAFACLLCTFCVHLQREAGAAGRVELGVLHTPGGLSSTQKDIQATMPYGPTIAFPITFQNRSQQTCCSLPPECKSMQEHNSWSKLEPVQGMRKPLGLR